MAVGAVVAMLTIGCNGCGDPALERFEQWLRAHPDRPGKVGTVRALEVERTARRVVDERVRRGEGPCDIGWRLDEPFVLDFEVEIEVEGEPRDRWWTEEGTWRRDETGRWRLDNDISFGDGDGLRGERTRRLYADDEHFLEWLGSDAAVRHPPDGSVEEYWREAFGVRFGQLMELIDERWGPEGAGQSARWTPGGDHRACGPVATAGEAADWRPLLEGGARLVRARLEGSEVGDDAQSDGACRQLEALYELRGDRRMTVRVRECIRDVDAAPLKRPDVERLVDPTRDRQRAEVETQLDEWIEGELIESVDGSRRQ